MVGVSQVAELASSWVGTPSRPGEANAIDLPGTLAAVRAARRLAPVVIVFMHWGTEGQACPDQAQLALAPELAAAGASIIIRAHAHMLQGSGWPAAPLSPTGRGLLWWERSYSAAIGVPELTITARTADRALHPAVVSGTGQPIADRGAAAGRAAAHYASLRACASSHRSHPERPAILPGHDRGCSGTKRPCPA